MAGRRSFLKTLAAAVVVLVTAPWRRAWAKKLAIPLAKAEKLKTIGGSLILKVKDRDILFIRDSETSIRALDPICTHEKCQVAYNAEQKHIDCPCHNSHFALDGKVLTGPAQTALRTYPATLDGDRILVTVE